ncbi:MAG: hypothetical protein R3C59_17825 [Planctomycetaceae bacterium]
MASIPVQSGRQEESAFSAERWGILVDDESGGQVHEICSGKLQHRRPEGG